MSVTILEALQNARTNLVDNAGTGAFIRELGRLQLDNAIALLEKGYGPHELIEPLLEQYGGVERVPDEEMP